MLSENKDTSPLVRDAFPMTKLPWGLIVLLGKSFACVTKKINEINPHDNWLLAYRFGRSYHGDIGAEVLHVAGL